MFSLFLKKDAVVVSLSFHAIDSIVRTREYKMSKCQLCAGGAPGRRTDASAPLSAGAASPPPPLVAGGGENLLHLSSPVKETVQ